MSKPMTIQQVTKDLENEVIIRKRLNGMLREECDKTLEMVKMEMGDDFIDESNVLICEY